ncbi:hypothetical protein [Leisingera daeponensis]|uniref:hypothetical protein n=1 Tax=Leisingera daeponensis TaxID=405746 RepID=UPI001C978615|nr:hypothetical protein [Leisingera daeponensis]MBY6056367.1 hypothetical protein [Leisingera daeponensis]
MLTKQVMLTSAMTLACALGLGVYMQSSGLGRLVEGAGETEMAPAELTGEPEQENLRLEKIALTSVPAAAPLETAESRRNQPSSAAECQMTVAAEAVAQAMVTFSVDAPCRANEPLTVHHSGMSFTVSLDSAGHYAAQLPALTRTAVFIAESASGPGAVAVAEVSDFGAVEHVVVQWSANSGFELHAREFGAAYGSAGHVWHGATAGTSAGRIIRLGDENLLAPRIAEIYSVPASVSGQSGSVALTAEAEVTGSNCGRDVFAQALQLRAGRLSTRDLVMAMPDCEAQGSFLVLNNLLEDLKIAAN